MPHCILLVLLRSERVALANAGKLDATVSKLCVKRQELPDDVSQVDCSLLPHTFPVANHMP